MSSTTGRGCTIWFTGLSGTGKTTVSTLVSSAIAEQGALVELLDGDVIREQISKDLGFSSEDRNAQVRRVGWVCQLLTRNRVIACAALISPYDALRREVRQKMGGDFLLVYCNAPLSVLEQRDPKGLYARARAGLIKGLTGVDAPYEAPEDHEVEVRSDGSETPQQSAAKVLHALWRTGYLQQRPALDSALQREVDARLEQRGRRAGGSGSVAPAGHDLL